MALAGHLPGFEYRPEVGRFRDYLWTTVRHAIARRFRRRDPVCGALPWNDTDSPLARDGKPDSDWEEEWTMHHLRLAMATLRGSFHQTSMAVFESLLSGGTPDKVASMHGTTIANVYKIKQRVRERLTAEVARLIDEGEFAERRRQD